MAIAVPHVRVVERLHVDVEADVEHVQRIARDELQIGVALDDRDVAGADVVDRVGGAGLELHEAGSAVGVPLEHRGRRQRSIAPVVGVGLEDDLAAALPRAEAVRAGADRRVDETLGVRDRYSLGAICSDENATFAAIAGSGAHSVSTNVCGSGASSLATLLVFVVGAAGRALVVTGSAPPAASVPAGSVPGGSVVANAVDAAVTTSAVAAIAVADLRQWRLMYPPGYVGSRPAVAVGYCRQAWPTAVSEG